MGSFCCFFFLSREWRCHDPAFCALDYNFRSLFSVLASLLVSCIEGNHIPAQFGKNTAHYNYIMACLGPCRHRTVHLIISMHTGPKQLGEKREKMYTVMNIMMIMKKYSKWKLIIGIPQFYLVWCVAVQFWICQSSHQKDHHSYKYLQVHTKNKLVFLSRDTIV